MTVDETMRAAIETVAKAKVAEALGGDVLGKLIDEVMKHKERSTYGKNEKTFFDVVVEDVLRETIRRAVRDEIAKNGVVHEKLKTAIETRAASFAVAVIDAFASDDWRAQLTVKLHGDS